MRSSTPWALEAERYFWCMNIDSQSIEVLLLYEYWYSKHRGTSVVWILIFKAWRYFCCMNMNIDIQSMEVLLLYEYWYSKLRGTSVIWILINSHRKPAEGNVCTFILVSRPSCFIVWGPLQTWIHICNGLCIKNFIFSPSCSHFNWYLSIICPQRNFV